MQGLEVGAAFGDVVDFAGVVVEAVEGEHDGVGQLAAEGCAVAESHEVIGCAADGAGADIGRGEDEQDAVDFGGDVVKA